jgi:two-component sensor histidine kinase
MTGGFLDGPVFRGLAFRILLFLSLALMPFGFIAVVQTQEMAKQTERTAELSLLGLTEQAAASERAAIQEAFGAASALGSVIGLYLDDPDACSDFMREYMAQATHYVHVGFIPTTGQITCTSSGERLDVSDNPNFAETMEWPARNVTASARGLLSAQPVLIINHPFQHQSAFAGYITLSLPLATIRGAARPLLDREPYDLLTFNAEGDLLLSDRGIENTMADAPRNRSLKALVGTDPTVFRDENEVNERLVYATVPIVRDVVYSMSIWREADVLTETNQTGRWSIFLPVLMWLASLVVAFWSLNRLAIRHIQKLGRQMRYFAFNRSMPRTTMGPDVPRELVEMQQAFIGMAESIIRDEAALEDSLREKNILLKEVHHRVKNNLQLISSIMNMQIRRAQTEDARFVLKRLQDRILSLATVHKNLYQSEALDRVDAGALIEEIVGQLLVVGLPAGSGVDVQQSYDRVMMDADDAAPLTLLVSEAVTNAMKYLGRSKPGPAHLSIRLEMLAEDSARFCIANSTGGAVGSEGTGLGSQLINAFARQLNATVDVSYEAGTHALTLTFPVAFREKLQPDF